MNLSNIDASISLPLRELVEILISPHEDVSETGYYGGVRIKNSVAKRLEKHPMCDKFCHIMHTKDETIYLFLRRDWENSYTREQIKRKESEIRSEEYRDRRNRFLQTLNKVCERYPHLRNSKSTAMNLIALWLEEFESTPEYKEYLLKFGYFQGAEESAAQIAEMKQQLEEYRRDNAEKLF